MYKHLLLVFLFVNALFANSYHFKESRYSDALERTFLLSGTISFKRNGLSISYDDSSRLLEYEDGELSMFEDDELLELEPSESEKIASYFELILLLNAGDTQSMDAAFTVETSAKNVFLKPKNELKNFITKIALTREDSQLKKLKLYLINSDTISISIEDEIH